MFRYVFICVKSCSVKMDPDSDHLRQEESNHVTCRNLVKGTIPRRRKGLEKWALVSLFLQKSGEEIESKKSGVSTACLSIVGDLLGLVYGFCFGSIGLD